MMRRVMCLLIVVGSTAMQALEYSGGSAPPENPCLITTVQDLVDPANEPNDYDKCLILTTVDLLCVVNLNEVLGVCNVSIVN